jgi:hypothetical protein
MIDNRGRQVTVTTALTNAAQCTELVKSPTTASVCGFK